MELKMIEKSKRIRHPYTPSPEAIERRKARDRLKSREKRAKERTERLKKYAVLQPTNRIGLKWRSRPKMPDMTKAELREMLAQAAQNTAAM